MPSLVYSCLFLTHSQVTPYHNEAKKVGTLNSSLGTTLDFTEQCEGSIYNAYYHLRNPNLLPKALNHFNVFTQSHYLALSQMHHFLFYLQEKAKSLHRPSPPLWITASNCVSSLSKQHHHPLLPKSANLGSILDSSLSLSTSNQLPNLLIYLLMSFKSISFSSIPIDFFCKLATGLNWTCHFPAWNPQLFTSIMITPRQSSPSPLDLALATVSDPTPPNLYHTSWTPVIGNFFDSFEGACSILLSVLHIVCCFSFHIFPDPSQPFLSRWSPLGVNLVTPAARLP